MKFLLVLLMLGLSGCAAYNPSVSTLRANQLTRAGIFNYASDVEEFCRARATKTRILGNSGAIGMAAGVAGVTVAAQRGASAGNLSLVAVIMNFFGQALGIVDPVERANAYNFCSETVMAAKADYLFETAMQDGAPDRDSRRYDQVSAALYKKVGVTVAATEKLLLHLPWTEEEFGVVNTRLVEIVTQAEEQSEEAAAAKIHRKQIKDAAAAAKMQ